jgi:hypothetical protein
MRSSAYCLLLQGLLAPEDAELAVQYGVDGIVVSNHGGRQMDYAPAAIDMLPGICAAVRGRAEVWVDGGVRRGTDVLKALALGARGVLLGRPVLYGLALGGQQGVEKVIRTIAKEFEMALALAGCARLSDVSPKLLLGADAAPGCCGGAAAGAAQCCSSLSAHGQQCCSRSQGQGAAAACCRTSKCCSGPCLEPGTSMMHRSKL